MGAVTVNFQNVITLAVDAAVAIRGELVLLIYALVTGFLFVPFLDTDGFLYGADGGKRRPGKGVFSLQIGKIQILCVGIDPENGIQVGCGLEGLFLHLNLVVFYFIEEGKYVHFFCVGGDSQLGVDGVAHFIQIGKGVGALVSRHTPITQKSHAAFW